MSNKKELTSDVVYTLLTESFPPEALSVDNSRGFELTSVKSQYIVERLNHVFGVENWKADYTVVLFNDTQCILKCVLIANFGNGESLIQRSAFGGSLIKKNPGDTIKSAMTDSLSKAASHIGIANDVFQGKVAPPSKYKPRVADTTDPVKPKSRL